jgi:hypothetical protein
MNKILRWLAYAIVAISAILIIWSLIGSCCHHSCHHEKIHKEMVCMKQTPKSNIDSVKTDSARCMHMKEGAHMMGKNDSVPMKHHEMSERIEVMPPCCMNPSDNLMNIAGKLLLLAIALLIIAGRCCCCSCECDDSKEDKKGV